MKQIVSIILLLFLIGCVSPSPEAQAPVNIRVFCGEQKARENDNQAPPESELSPVERDRFWYELPPNPQWEILPNPQWELPNTGGSVIPHGNLRHEESMCCGNSWNGPASSTCTMLCPEESYIYENN